MRFALALAIPLVAVACGNTDANTESSSTTPTVDLLQPFPPLDTDRPGPCDTANPEDTDNPCAE